MTTAVGSLYQREQSYLGLYSIQCWYNWLSCDMCVCVCVLSLWQCSVFIKSDICCVKAWSDRKGCERTLFVWTADTNFIMAVCFHLFAVLDLSPRGPRLGDLAVSSECERLRQPVLPHRHSCTSIIAAVLKPCFALSFFPLPLPLFIFYVEHGQLWILGCVS